MRAGRPGKFIAERVAAVGVRFGLRCWPHGRFESRRWRNEPNGSATSPSCGSTAWATDLQDAAIHHPTCGFPSAQRLWTRIRHEPPSAPGYSRQRLAGHGSVDSTTGSATELLFARKPGDGCESPSSAVDGMT
jgi:hypothetical protein